MWLLKISETDMQRISNNIARLKSASEKIHHLSKIVFNSQRSAFDMLKEVLDYPIITGREIVRNKLLSACYGINNQKIALDSPHVEFLVTKARQAA